MKDEHARCLVCGKYFQAVDQVTRMFQGNVMDSIENLRHWGAVHTDCWERRVAIPKATVDYIKKMAVKNQERKNREKKPVEVDVQPTVEVFTKG